MAITVTLEATYGGPAANTYVETLAEAEELVLFLKSLKGYGVVTTGWETVASPSTQIKNFAMVQAATIVDTAPFVGDQYDTNQARQFPRTNTGQVLFDHTTEVVHAPDVVKLAQMAQACELLRSQNDITEAARRGVASETIGDHSTVFDQSAMSRAESNQLCSAAYKILRNAGLVLAGSGSVYIPRG